MFYDMYQSLLIERLAWPEVIIGQGSSDEAVDNFAPHTTLLLNRVRTLQLAMLIHAIIAQVLRQSGCAGLQRQDETEVGEQQDDGSIQCGIPTLLQRLYGRRVSCVQKRLQALLQTCTKIEENN